MPKIQWGSPEHFMNCPDCGEPMKWVGSTKEDTRVIGFITKHHCVECWTFAWMLLDNDRNVKGQYVERTIGGAVSWWENWSNPEMAVGND